MYRYTLVQNFHSELYSISMYIKLLKVMGLLSMSKLCALYIRTILLKWSLCFNGEKLMLIVVLLLFSNISSCLAHQSRNEQYGYEGRFIEQDEAKAIALDANTRLAKIPCNFTTKTNCIYVEQPKLTLPKNNSLWRQQHANKIVVSWVTNSDNLNKTEYIIGMETNKSNRNKNNIRDKNRNNFIDLNWIFELLACMTLASAFEVCLLILRNLRNIGLTIFGIWSVLIIRIQKLCKACFTRSLKKSDQQHRKRSVAVDEKRTLSYIFAILTWRATQTAKCSGASDRTTLRDDNTNNVMSYGHVTTMGDLLLLILFTHVYYQRQRIEKGGDKEDSSDEPRQKNQNNKYYQQFYDKQNNTNGNEGPINKQSLNNKRCSYFCGNTYQQISSLQELKFSQSQITPPVTSCVPKLPYLTYCNGMVWYTCCFCKYSFSTCYFCCCNCRLLNQNCYLYTQLRNTMYRCCFLKFLKSRHEVNCYHSCCWQDICTPETLKSHPSYHYCCHYCQRAYTYCSLCNTLINKKPLGSFNVILQSKIRIIPLVTLSQYGLWKLRFSNKTMLHMLMNNHKICDITLHIITSMLLQYLMPLKNCQNVLKWKRLQVAVVIVALIVARSSSGPDNDYQNCNNSLFNSCNSLVNSCKLFAKQKKNTKRRRRRRRHQHCKFCRPLYYFNTTPIQCIKRLKLKKINKKFLNKLKKKFTKPQTSKTTINEKVVNSSKASMVRSIRRLRGSKPNIVWLLIGLIWFEGPKIVICNVIINYQYQQHEQQHHQQQHQQTGNSHKETTTNTVNSNFEYKTENFNQIKTKSNNNSNNSNNNNNKSKNKNKNTGSNNNSNSNGNEANNNNRNTNSSNINLSVNVIPIINTIHLKHYCNSNYYQNVIRLSQRVQRALKTHPNSDIIVTSSASENQNKLINGLTSATGEMAISTLSQTSDLGMYAYCKTILFFNVEY